MGWGTFFGKIAEQFQGRIERLKNEKAKLEAERTSLMQGSANEKKAKRVVVIERRLIELSKLLENKAS